MFWFKNSNFSNIRNQQECPFQPKINKISDEIVKDENFYLRMKKFEEKK